MKAAMDKMLAEENPSAQGGDVDLSNFDAEESGESEDEKIKEAMATVGYPDIDSTKLSQIMGILKPSGVPGQDPMGGAAAKPKSKMDALFGSAKA